MNNLRVYLKEFNQFAEQVCEINFEDKVVRIENGDYFGFDEVEFYLGNNKMDLVEEKAEKYDEMDKLLMNWADNDILNYQCDSNCHSCKYELNKHCFVKILKKRIEFKRERDEALKQIHELNDALWKKQEHIEKLVHLCKCHENAMNHNCKLFEKEQEKNKVLVEGVRDIGGLFNDKHLTSFATYIANNKLLGILLEEGKIDDKQYNKIKAMLELVEEQE